MQHRFPSTVIAALSLATGLCPAAHARPAAPPAAQAPAAPSANATDGLDTAALTTVHLDVIVTNRRGEPIHRLRASDFSVTEAGVARPIEAATFRAALPEPAAVPIGAARDAAPAGRVFGLLLDDYHVSPGAGTQRARDALNRFVDTALRPGDGIVIMRPLDQPGSLEVTRDRAAIHDAIDAFTGRLGDDTPRTAFERDFMGRAPAAVETARAQMVLSALETLATWMAALPQGRKTIVLVSGGFEPAPRQPRVRLPGTATIIRIASRFNLAIYPVDPDPPDPVTAGAARLAILRELAERTSGTLITAAGDPAPALAAMAREAREYYLLTFRAPAADGRLHDVTVHVNAPGAQVRARPAYWVPSLAELRLVRQAAVVRARPLPKLVPIKPSHTSGLIRSWVGIARGADGRPRVTVTWEPNHEAISRRRPVQADTVELTATTPDGTPLFKGPVDPVAGAGDRDGRRPAAAVFAAPPGRIELSLDIRAEGHDLDTDVRHVEVPALDKVGTILMPAEVFRAFTAREYDALRTDAHATPVASAEFSRSAHLLIRIRAYGPGSARPVVTARLLNLLGQPMRTLDRIPGPSGQPDVTQFDLPLSPFPTGNYTIEFQATSAAGDARSLLSIRIVS